MALFDINCPECGQNKQITLPKGKEPVDIEGTGLGGSITKSMKNDLGLEGTKETYMCRNCDTQVHIYYE